LVLADIVDVNPENQWPQFFLLFSMLLKDVVDPDVVVLAPVEWLLAVAVAPAPDAATKMFV
jgi:hypothetical protein